METRTCQIRNSNMTVHSPSGIIAMTPEQQRNWFRLQWESRNVIVCQMVDSALAIDADVLSADQRMKDR